MDIIRKETYYDRLTAEHEWDEMVNLYETERRLNLIFDRLLAIENIRGRRFLDAGSGGGHFSAAADQRGAEVYSLDIGTFLLRQVAERCTSKRVAGNVRELPFADRAFDIVLSTEVIEHTADPLVAVIELCRVLAPGGILIITTPCRLWQPLVRLATKLKLRPYEGFENFIWPWELVNNVVEQGLVVKWVGGFNFCPLFWRRLNPLFNAFDRIMGNSFPWLMVNIGMAAHRPIDKVRSNKAV